MAGGAIVSWTDRSQDPQGDIRAQRLNTAGFRVWNNNGEVLCNVAGAQSTSHLAIDEAGGAFAVWEDLRNDAGDIYGQRVTTNGETQWPVPSSSNGVGVYTGTGRQRDPRVISDDNGGFIAAWRDQANTDELHTTRFYASGLEAWSSDRLVGHIDYPLTGSGSINFGIERDGSGGIVLAWGSDDDIRAQRLDSAGAKVWTTGNNGIPMTAGGSPNYRRTAPAIAAFGDGGAVVAWGTYRAHGALDSNIYSLQIAPYGLVSGTAGGDLVGGAQGDQWLPSVQAADLCGSKFAWADQRPGDPGAYMQRRDRQWWFRCLPKIPDSWITVDSRSDLVPFQAMKLGVVGHANDPTPVPSDGGVFELAYDPLMFQVENVRFDEGGLAGATSVVSIDVPGLVRVEIFGEIAIEDGGLLFELEGVPVVDTGVTVVNLTTATLGGEPMVVEAGRLEINP